MVRKYQELVVWQKAMEMVTAVYECSRSFPREEVYGLTSQLRRSAVSIPSNIAEGQGKLSTGEFLQYLGHSRASLFEAETQIQLARNLGYLQDDAFRGLMDRTAEVGRLLNGLITSLRK